MSARPAGIVSFQTNAAATAFPQIEIDAAANITIQVTEIGISQNGPPNATDTPPDWSLRRASAGGAGGTAITPAKMQADTTTTLQTTAKSHGGTPFTTQGTLQDQLHRWFVPIVTGMIWVAAPGREVDCEGADFIQLMNVAALPASRAANVYIVFEE